MNKPKQQKIHKPLVGKHVVSKDGAQLFIGGKPFKRTVLPGPGDNVHKHSIDDVLNEVTSLEGVREVSTEIEAIE